MKKLEYKKGELIFPCGIRVEIEEDKLRWIYSLFKLDKEFEYMLKYTFAEIPKSKASQIKQHLT